MRYLLLLLAALFAAPSPGDESPARLIPGVSLGDLDVDGTRVQGRYLPAEGHVSFGLLTSVDERAVIEIAVADDAAGAWAEISAFRARCERTLVPATTVGLQVGDSGYAAADEAGRIGVVTFVRENVFIVVRGDGNVADVARAVDGRLTASKRVREVSDIPRPRVRLPAQGPARVGEDMSLVFEASDPRDGAAIPTIALRSPTASVLPDGGLWVFRADTPGSHKVTLTAVNDLNLVARAEVAIVVE